MRVKRKSFYKDLCIFLLGGILYVLCELIFRHRSHWTMFLLGGLCYYFDSIQNEGINIDTPLWKQVLYCTLFTTVGEFFTGVVVNIILKWNVWDYSNMPLNIYGQICLPFTLLFAILNLIAIIFDDFYRYIIYDEEKPHYKLK